MPSMQGKQDYSRKEGAGGACGKGDAAGSQDCIRRTS